MSKRNAFVADAKKILPFWIFIFFFKAAAALHYTLLSALGARVLPVWAVGFLIGGGALIQVLLDVPTGYLLDRFGYVRLLRIGVLCFFGALACLLVGLTPLTFVATIALATAGWLVFGPGVDGFVLSRTKKEFAGRFVGLKDVLLSGGDIMGLMLLPLVISFATPTIGKVLAVPLAVALLAILILRTPRHKAVTEKKIAAQGFYIRRQYLHRLFGALKKLNPASGMLCLLGLSGSLFYGIIWFVVPLMLSRDLASGALGFGLATFDTAVLLTGFLAGELTDRWDKRWLVFWGLLLFAACAAVLGFNFGIWFIVLGFLATTGDELSNVSLWAWMDYLDKDHADDAIIAGAISLSQDLGWTIGPMIAGILFGVVGPSWTIACGSVFIFLTWFVALLFAPNANIPVIVTPHNVPRPKRH